MNAAVQAAARAAARAVLKQEFEFVARHYGCSEAERAEMREIAERDLIAAGECFAYLAFKIRRGDGGKAV